MADDRLTNAQIAALINVTRQTIDNWKAHPDFAARVAEHVTAQREAVMSQGIADKVKRVAALDDRWDRMQTVIAERAADDEWSDVAGWETGLLVHQRKQIGGGRDAQVVDEFAVDTGLLRELRAHEEQAAKELGQWTEKSDLNVSLTGELEALAKEFGKTVDEVRADLSDVLGKAAR